MIAPTIFSYAVIGARSECELSTPITSGVFAYSGVESSIKVKTNVDI